MKKLLVPIVAALVLALALPAVSSAKSKHYAGTLAPSGTVSFKVIEKVIKKGKKRRKVRGVSNFTFTAVPVTCTDGAHTTSGTVTFVVPLKKSFTIHAKSSATGATVDINGTTATGTVHVVGNVPLDGTETQGSNCDSGVLTWTAARG